MNLIGRANRQKEAPSPLFEEETDLIINGLAGFHIDQPLPEIILNVAFPPEIMNEYELTSTTVFATFNQEGTFQQASLAENGIPSPLLLTEEEHQAIELYIYKNKFAEQLLKELDQKNLQPAK